MPAFSSRDRLVDSFNRVQCVDVFERLVVANAHDPRKSQRESALMAGASLDAVEGNFENDPRFDQAKAAEFLDRVLFEERGHLQDLGVREPGVSFPDVEQLAIFLNGAGTSRPNHGSFVKRSLRRARGSSISVSPFSARRSKIINAVGISAIKACDGFLRPRRFCRSANGRTWPSRYPMISPSTISE